MVSSGSAGAVYGPVAPPAPPRPGAPRDARLLLGAGRRGGGGRLDHGGLAAAVAEVLRPVALVRRARAHVRPRGKDVPVVAARVAPRDVRVAETAGLGDVLRRPLPFVAGVAHAVEGALPRRARGGVGQREVV